MFTRTSPQSENIIGSNICKVGFLMQTNPSSGDLHNRSGDFARQNVTQSALVYHAGCIKKLPGEANLQFLYYTIDQ